MRKPVPGIMSCFDGAPYVQLAQPEDGEAKWCYERYKNTSKCRTEILWRTGTLFEQYI